MSRNKDIYGMTQNLSIADRITSAILGATLIGIVLNYPEGHYLGWLSLLPIIAIYPCLAAMIGYSPLRTGLYSAIDRIQQHRYILDGHMNGLPTKLVRNL